MNHRIFNAITGRLSLRPPQAESLEKLAKAIDAAPEILTHERDLNAVLSVLMAEFPTLEEFEREFPSLCFALAPNLTIYDKLIADFTPNTPNPSLTCNLCKLLILVNIEKLSRIKTSS